MISPTQTMENTTFDFTPSFKNPDDMPEYVSIYDRPKRGRGRPKTCKLPDEEKRQRKLKLAQQYYQHNFDYVRLQKRIWLDKQYEQVSSEDTICIHPIDCTVTKHIFSRLLEMIRLKNKRLLFFMKPY